VDYARVDKLKGMNVTIVTTAKDDNQARALLRQFGIPFRQDCVERDPCQLQQNELKTPAKPKFSSRQHNRCQNCGRPVRTCAVRLCRLCFRQLALRGEIPGVVKSSW